MDTSRRSDALQGAGMLEIHSMDEIRALDPTDAAYGGQVDYVVEIAEREASEAIAKVAERVKCDKVLPPIAGDGIEGNSVHDTLGKAQVASYLKRVNRVYRWDHAAGEMRVQEPEEGVITVVRALKLKQADMFGGSDPYAEVYWNDARIGRTQVNLACSRAIQQCSATDEDQSNAFVTCIGRTQHIEDTHDPEWQESFPVLVEPGQVNTLRVELS